MSLTKVREATTNLVSTMSYSSRKEIEEREWR